ncbi:MAG: efflux RND transporter periplasmic adaptor subunit [Legionellaceae bacterium]|nr:efflux RND transporter periplasmic adaptor subunit [Legionellaceae bacterium]
MMRYRFFFPCLLMIALLLSACGSEPGKTASHSYSETVQKHALHKTLHFSGTIQALSESSLISPIDAVIEQMPVRYGEAVAQNSRVFTLNSNELQKQYNESLTDYLKAKDNFSMNQAKFQGAEELWQAGLLSKNSYLSEKSNLDNARVTMLQSRRKFTELLDKIDNNPEALAELSLAEFDKVRQALAVQHNRIHLNAPSEGILLYPPKSGEDKTQRLTVGSAVKAGQVLGLIGNLSGVRVEIDIPEIDIDKVHRGMKASIRGLALGEEVLQGELAAVNGQASSAGSNSLPVFNATVIVKELSPEQKERIRVGMSATVELDLQSFTQIMIPIAALHLEQGQSLVEVRKPNGHSEMRMVRTGAALQDKVAIVSGLQEGEDIIIHETR